MASKAPKKKESRERVASAARTIAEQSVAPSIVGSQNDKDEKNKKNKMPIIIWPEWSEQDINQEKWETAHKAKEKEKGKSPNLHPYEDPEGRIDLPAAIKSRVDHWRRPVEFITEKTPVIVEQKSFTEEVDLLSVNDHLTHSETLRCIISQVMCLWKLHFKVEVSEVKTTKEVKEGKGDKDKDKDKDKEKDKDGQVEDNHWKPWGHIWPKEKTKGSALPVYNPGGKYCVKLHWLGSWRKVTVDDWMPFDEEGKMLLPASPNEQELWPMLLSKALLKVCSLDYAGGSPSCEFGDFSAVHCLTGWLPEIIPLRSGRTGEIWKLLLQSLPRWKLENTAAPPVEESKQASPEGKRMGDREKDRKSTKSDKGQSHDKFHSDKSKDKDKDKAASVAGVPEQPKEPEVVIFASYSHPPTAPMRISVLREMADASEKLRQSGFSHNHPHPVMVTMIRDCPLVAPPPPVQIPRWKLIRQKKKPQPVEPAVTPPEPPRDPQFLQVASPFVNYNVSPVPVSRARTPIRWVKFRPEKPMGEICEEGDKDGDENKENNEQKGEGGESGEAADEATKEAIPKCDPEETKPTAEQEKEKEGRDSKESLSRERSGTKDSSKVSARDRVKSGRSDRSAEKTDKPAKSAEKSRSGTKLSVADSPVRTKSGGSGKGRRMSRIEKPAGEPRSPETRRMSRMERMKSEVEKEPSAKTEAILEEEQAKSLVVPPGMVDGEKPAGEGTDGESPNENGEGEKCEEGDKTKEQQNKEKKLWMDFEDFCKCFGHLFIFHKPNTYQYTKSSIDLKNVAMTGHVNKKSGLAPTASVTGTTPAPGKATALSPSPYHSSYGAQAQSQDPPPPYLFVDSLKPIEIVVNFTSFSRWLDPPLPIVREKDKEKEKDTMSTITDMRDILQTEERQAPPTQGLLVAEPYSWKSLVTGQPVLRIRTTGTKAAVLVLPPGRHVMRFLIQSPHGYNVEMCSQTSFVYGDEDAVMGCLTKESCRFIEHAMKVLQSVGRLLSSFSDPPPLSEKRIDLDLELNDQTKEIQDRHYKVFTKCLFKTLKGQLGDAYDADMHFAWKSFSFQAALSLRQPITRRPLSAADISRIGAMKRRSPVKSASTVPPTWVDRSANGEEEMAALKIQTLFRGFFVRKLARAYCSNSVEQQQVSELLAKAWAAIEPNLEEFAIEIFRRMFKRDPELFPLFPFFTDEWSRVAFTDYNGAFPEQPPHSWFVVFREVFFVDEPVLMVPKLYVNLPTCLLRVVDNDTGEELTRVFQRVAPSNLKKNKRGYTFVGEARTLSAILPPGKFRLRVIGSTEPLPYPARDGVNSHFVTKEIRDYYIPNMYNIIFRYTVKVPEDHMASLQLGTSKTDVHIKLQILDHEQEVTSTTGRGHVVIPAFMFFRDRTGDEDDRHSVRGSRPTTSSHPRSGKRPQSGRKAASPIQTRVGKKSAKESNTTSRPGSSSVRHKGSRPLLSQDSEDKEEEEEVNDDEPEVKVHKYVIQAQVLRDSWPLSKSAWDFIAMLKNLDRLDVEGPVETNPRGEKLSASTSKAKKGKEGKESRSSKGQAGSRPSSQQFDSSKPNWTLRIVSDASVEEIEVKKDTERQDEIKAMKQAWEAAEPGRAAKARQSRQKFLNEHLVKIEKDAIEEENGNDEPEEKEAPSEIFTVTSPIQSDAEQGELTLTPPPKEPDQVLQPPEPPKYIRSRGGNPVLLDAAEEERRRPERQEKFREFKLKKEEMEKLRELDRQERNAAKERQLQIAEQLQAALDKARQEVSVPREAYRQKFLEAEKQEEQAQAAEAAKEKDRSPSPGKSRKSASTAKGGRKTPSKGKKK